MKKINVLHIVPWFPNSDNGIEAVFIVEHLKALTPYCQNEVLHVTFGKNSYESIYQHEGLKINRINIRLLIDKWFFKEVFVARKIENFIKQKEKIFDVVNFHVAYPNAVKINKLVLKFSNLKFVITEHWTAYHYCFGLKKGSPGRGRIENIFKNNIPLIVVSNALGQDIQKFIGLDERDFYVVPNVVDAKSYKYFPKTNMKEDFVFSSINNWNPMKNPFVLIRAFRLMANKYDNVRLILGGTGKIITEMKTLAEELSLEKIVKFTGRLTKGEVVETFKQSNIYCQSSNYETFSVICAEALMSGVPVIAHNIGGMKDFISEENGALVDDLSVESWFLAMEDKYLNYESIDRQKSALECMKKFNSDVIGKQYYSILQSLI